MSSMKDKMHTGELYLPGDEEIMRHQLKRLDRLYDFNMTRPTELKKREEMLREMFAEIGDDCYIEPPFHSNFGGEHVHFGNHIYANFGLTLVDDTHIYVGDNTMFGPHVTVATAGHPIDPTLRAKEYQYNMPIHIGKNCWIGAGSLILPGVTPDGGGAFGVLPARTPARALPRTWVGVEKRKLSAETVQSCGSRERSRPRNERGQAFVECVQSRCTFVFLYGAKVF